MQVFSGHVTSHRSRNESSKMWERGNRDGDKLLCNTKICLSDVERIRNVFAWRTDIFSWIANPTK